MPEFEIGTTQVTMTNVVDLATPVESPKSAYRPFVSTIKLMDGTSKGLGLPVASWHFPVLTLEQRNQLKTFCPGASAHVFIRTKLNDDTYDDFEADMIWPEEEERKHGLKFGLTVGFRNLVPA